MFGVCYYPEHWSRSQWSSDARQMVELGLTFVRIGEFAWSRLEQREGEYSFEWMDEAIQTLADSGLKVVLGTPTATPPKWLIDKYPEILPVDPGTGRIRGFGSRRHYDFASDVYLRESLGITRKMARRYGNNKAVVGWQTDNELGCHDSALSASDVSKAGFRQWCEKRYPSIDVLNTSWGNVFWSMEYLDFDAIELPVGAVTETSPAHLLAWRRFSSDCMIRFHNQMVGVIRSETRDQFVTHNFIPTVDTGVDNFALAAPLDFSSYDSYPLGRSEQFFADVPDADFERYMRTGHPDLTTYALDQTRGLNRRGFWIMEQQPGPVNWASHNPRPAPGMIRFWTLEAFAHGAECVSYFRWRQAPFAQEQMHAGLLRPDNSKATAWGEAERAIADVKLLGLGSTPQPHADVAIVTSCESYWVSDIENQSAAYDFDRVQFDYYRALRACGLNIDFVSAEADVSGYKLVVIPGLPMIPQSLVDQCLKGANRFVFGPRSGAKTDEFGYPLTLPPGPLQQVIPIRVLSVETLRPGCPQLLRWPQEGYKDYDSVVWREELDTSDAKVVAYYDDESPAVVSYNNVVYIGTLTGSEFLEDFLRDQCEQLNISTTTPPMDVRVQRRGNLVFAFNYGQRETELDIPESAHIVLGGNPIKVHDVTVWKIP